jgi:hypothetical protein
VEDLTAVDTNTGESFSVLQPHLVVTVKSVRAVMMQNDLTEGSEDEDVDPGFYVGRRSGSGEILTFADFNSAAEYFKSRASEPVKLKMHREEEPEPATARKKG